MLRSRFVLCTAIVLSGATSPVMAFHPIGIFSEVAGHPTAQVPGDPAGSYFTAFDRPYRSPDGNSWIITGSRAGTTTTDEVIVIGAGPTYVGANTVVREGSALPAAIDPTGTRQWGAIDRNVGLNNAGNFVFAADITGATTNDDEMIVLNKAGTWSTPAREGQPLPPPFATQAFDGTVDSPSITSTDKVSWRAPSTIGPLATANETFIAFGTQVVGQSGITVPGNQQVAPTTRTLVGSSLAFGSQDYYRDDSGNNYMYSGALVSPTTSDAVIVVNDNVVVQEDGTIPGVPDLVTAIFENVMMPNGDWFARGDNDDLAGNWNTGEDWILYNGSLIAKVGDPVVGGLPGETYDDAAYAACFFDMVSNNVGNWVIGAVTNNTDLAHNAVLVLNGTGVVAREGDPVDLDGNGLFDDNVFISVFNNDDMFLTDDLTLYFTADIVDGAGAALGQAFLAVPIPEPASLVLLALGGLLLGRRR